MVTAPLKIPNRPSVDRVAAEPANVASASAALYERGKKTTLFFPCRFPLKHLVGVRMGETEADGTKMANLEGRLIFKGMREEKWSGQACMSSCQTNPSSVQQHSLATCGASQCFACVLELECLSFLT